jgi:ankyrin repeat protein
MDIATSSLDRIIADRYQLVELLGEGGSGSTYRAMRLADGATVAIKILSLRHLNDWKQLELFEREANVLAQISHPQIPKYLEYFHVDTPDNRAFYIVQQLAPGKPLTAWVQAGWRGTEAQVRDIANQLLAILQYLHQQSPPLIHRDLKPHNIIRNDDGRIFLVDFGAVQNVYHNTLLKGCTVAGTFGYMAPEQFRGAAVPASDLYGLGATILYLLTHRSPADLPQERLKLSFRSHVNISAHFADWLELMLEPDTATRFSSADVALHAFQRQHRFRIQKGIGVGFPWKGVAVTAIILSICTPLVDRYRHTFITRLGLPAYDICNAIDSRGIESLHEYLDRGVSVNANVVVRERDGELAEKVDTGSLLHCAIQHERVEIVEYLLKHGADPHALNSDGLAPLHHAIKFNYATEHQDPQIVRQIVHLLLKYKADVNISSSLGRSPLMFAVETVNLQIFTDLLQHGAKIDVIDNQKSSLWHILSGNANFQRGDDYDIKLHAIADLLMAAKLDPNRRNDKGNTPLHEALENYNQVTISLLLDYRVKTDVKNAVGQTPLITAIEHQNFDIAKLLVLKGAGIDVPDSSGKTPLMVAIDRSGFEDSSSHFTHQNFTDRSGRSIDKNQPSPKIINLLIDPSSEGIKQSGANLKLTDRQGNTALHFLGNLGEVHSVTNGCLQNRSLAIYTLKLMMQHQVDTQIVNQNGDTALHVVASQDFFPLTEQMIHYGWNPHQKNRLGRDTWGLIKLATPRGLRCQNLGNKKW